MRHPIAALAAVCLALSCVLLAAPAAAASLTATPADALAVVTALAQPGDVVTLAPGVYGPVNLRGRTFNPPLTINATGATLTNWTFRDGGGLVLNGATVVTVCDPLKVCGAGLAVERWNGFIAKGLTALGPEESRPGYMGAVADGTGLRIASATAVTVSDSDFIGWERGLTMTLTDGFTVKGNHFTRMRVDGLDVALSHKGVIEANNCEGFRRLTDEHPDCIQLWSRPTVAPVSDVAIRGNKATGDMQGVGMFNHIRDGVDDGGFDRIVIEDNDIATSHPQGIALYDGRDSIIRNNRVRTLAGATMQTRITIQNPTRVTRCGNAVEAALGRPARIDAPCT
jgi:hypothetical protein